MALPLHRGHREFYQPRRGFANEDAGYFCPKNIDVSEVEQYNRKKEMEMRGEATGNFYRQGRYNTIGSGSERFYEQQQRHGRPEEAYYYEEEEEEEEEEDGYAPYSSYRGYEEGEQQYYHRANNAPAAEEVDVEEREEVMEEEEMVGGMEDYPGGANYGNQRPKQSNPFSTTFSRNSPLQLGPKSPPKSTHVASPPWQQQQQQQQQANTNRNNFANVTFPMQSEDTIEEEDGMYLDRKTGCFVSSSVAESMKCIQRKGPERCGIVGPVQQQPTPSGYLSDAIRHPNQMEQQQQQPGVIPSSASRFTPFSALSPSFDSNCPVPESDLLFLKNYIAPETGRPLPTFMLQPVRPLDHSLAGKVGTYELHPYHPDWTPESGEMWARRWGRPLPKARNVTISGKGPGIEGLKLHNCGVFYRETVLTDKETMQQQSNTPLQRVMAGGRRLGQPRYTNPNANTRQQQQMAAIPNNEQAVSAAILYDSPTGSPTAAGAATLITEPKPFPNRVVAAEGRAKLLDPDEWLRRQALRQQIAPTAPMGAGMNRSSFSPLHDSASIDTVKRSDLPMGVVVQPLQLQSVAAVPLPVVVAATPSRMPSVSPAPIHPQQQPHHYRAFPSCSIVANSATAVIGGSGDLQQPPPPPIAAVQFLLDGQNDKLLVGKKDDEFALPDIAAVQFLKVAQDEALKRVGIVVDEPKGTATEQKVVEKKKETEEEGAQPKQSLPRFENPAAGPPPPSQVLMGTQQMAVAPPHPSAIQSLHSVLQQQHQEQLLLGRNPAAGPLPPSPPPQQPQQLHHCQAVPVEQQQQQQQNEQFPCSSSITATTMAAAVASATCGTEERLADSFAARVAASQARSNNSEQQTLAATHPSVGIARPSVPPPWAAPTFVEAGGKQQEAQREQHQQQTQGHTDDFAARVAASQAQRAEEEEELPRKSAVAVAPPWGKPQVEQQATDSSSHSPAPWSNCNGSKKL